MSRHFWFASASRRRLAAVALLVLPLAVVAAGSGDAESSPSGPTSPAPPSGVANISGSWTGTAGWKQHDVHAIGHVTMSFTQDDRAVTGTLAFASPAYDGWAGAIDGVVAGTSPDTQFVGTIELRAPAPAGSGTCVGSAVFSGRSVNDALRWGTSRLHLSPDAGSRPGSACRGLLRDVALILER